MSEVAEQGVMKTTKGYKKSKIGELNGPRTKANESKWEEISVELTVDCLLEIFKYLSVLNRIRIARVNKTWHEASRLSLSSLKSWKIEYGYYKIVFKEFKTNSRIEVDCASHKVFEELLLRFGEFVSDLDVSSVENDSQVMIILSTCRNLVKVHISHMCIYKVRFLLWKLEKLNDLTLYYMKGIDKDGCLELVLSRLRLTSFYIQYENLEISDEFFKILPSDIIRLGISDCRFTNKRSAFNMLGNFKHLRSLALTWDTLPIDTNVEQLINLIKELNLKKLNISWNDVVDDDFLIKFAKHADGLTELNISGNEITDRGLNAVTNLPNLETLLIQELEEIKGNVNVNLPNLKCLRCRGSKLSEKALIKFLKSSDKIEILVAAKISEEFIRAAGKVVQARKSQIPMKIVIAPNDKDIVNNCSEEDTRQLKIVTYNDEL